jgi:hypothetical protein
MGLVAGIGAWFRPLPSSESVQPAHSDEEISNAKNAVCEAFSKGVRSFQIAGNRKVDSAPEALPIAVNTRLAEVAVSNYLINSVVENPPVPTELKELIQQLAHSYQDIALAQLADSADYGQSASAADSAISKIREICQ